MRKSCLGAAATVANVVLFLVIFLGVDDVASKVSGNKINPIFYYADLFFSISVSTSTYHR